ncbi:MAG TPA: cobyric acid synthase CobQ, partial [Acidimicrobiia bacterium]|nr:cobyric acid synthase CobQ [Acidimicrobiia bacterium]
EGAASRDGAVIGTSLHGLFESDSFRTAFLEAVAARRGKAFRASGLSFAAAREAQFDRLADLLEAHLDLPAVDKLIASAKTVAETV